MASTPLLDTNPFLRHLLNDHARHSPNDYSPRAEALIECIASVRACRLPDRVR